MPTTPAKMYDSLTEQQRSKVNEFIFSFYQQNTKKKFRARKVVDAFGMWKDRDDMGEVDAFVRNLRRGRRFDS